MTFDAKERSRQSGKPITLFFVRYGAAAANYYAVTNAEQAVLYNGITYQPVSSTHSGIKRVLTLDDSGLTFTLPSDHPLAARWRSYPPSEVTSVVLRQGHIDDAEFPVVWIGRVLGSKDNHQDETTEFSCEPRSTSLQRQGLNRNYQYGCPHLLYSQGEGLCNANKAAATSTFEAVAINGARITLAAGWNALGAARLDYVTGFVEWTTEDNRYEARTIISVDEATGEIGLTGRATDLTPGMDVKVILGCNHRAYTYDGGDCERLHNNVQNFGGQPLIPTTNPIGVKNVFN